jgi:hypothetical protein
VPTGYTADQTDCVNVPLGGSCTITNTALGSEIPTVSGWGMTLLLALLALLGLTVIRRLS